MNPVRKHGGIYEYNWDKNPDRKNKKEEIQMSEVDFSSITDMIIALIPLILVVVIMQLLVKMFVGMTKDFN